MSAITISRQLGSLGDEVAQAISARTGYRIISRELINQAARQAGVPEVALATIDDLNLLGLRPSTADRHAYHQAISTLMHSVVDSGQMIIIGRAGQIILQDHPQVLHVKVIAPAELRSTRIARSEGISLENARARISASDKSRRSYLSRYYHVRWDDPELYDVMINTARLDPDQAACLVCQALQQCFPYRANA